MNLFDRLKPRWRRSDPEQRAAAVREMGPNAQRRLATLVANDPDAGVRRAAIKRLEDPTALDLVAERDPEPALRTAARERADEVRVRLAAADRSLSDCELALAAIQDERSLTAVTLAAVHPEIRRAAASRLSGERALREIVTQSRDAEIARAALARIRNAATLRAIALGDGPPELALAAVELIDDVAMRRAIASSKAASKAVRRRARELLPAGIDDALALDAEAARARQIEPDTTIQAVPARPDVDRAEAEQTRDRRQAVLAARRELCARVEELAGADVPGQIDAATAAWQRLGSLPGDHEPELERRFRAACRARRERYEQTVREDAQRADLLALVEEAERAAERGSVRDTDLWRRLERRWASIPVSQQAAADLAELRLRFAGAADRFRQRQEEARAQRAAQERANLLRVEALLARLEGMAGAESVKLAAARAELKAADAALADLGPLPSAERRRQWKERLAAARVPLERRVADLEETERWRRWANTDAQEAIIARAEALRASDDLPAIDTQLKQLQQEWAQCATASPDRAQVLWTRFRAVRDELRKRVDAYLASNLELKRALCDRVAAIGDSTEWKETADLIKQAQAEWKEIGPVPARLSQQIWHRFREPADRFFERRKAHFDRVDEERRGNADRQAALCERAEALRDSTDWDATAAALKDLQSEWKRSGPAPRDRADALWGRFRAACDGFFDRFHRRDAVERENAVAQARGLCEQLEALVAALGGESAPAPDAIRAQLDETWGCLSQLGLASAAAPLRVRFDAACTEVAAAAPEALLGSRLDPASTARRRERLCERVEALVNVPVAEPRTPSLQEQVLALRDRLATNTIAKDDAGTGKGMSGREQAGQLRLKWQALGPPLDDEARRLEERFNAALARLEQLENATVASD